MKCHAVKLFMTIEQENPDYEFVYSAQSPDQICPEEEIFQFFALPYQQFSNGKVTKHNLYQCLRVEWYDHTSKETSGKLIRKIVRNTPEAAWKVVV